MVLPEPFTTASPAIASYDYFDIADGTGIQNFYAYQSITAAASVYGLTTDNTIYSGKIAEKFIGGFAFTKRSDLDYDVTLNLPKIVNGELVVSVSQGVGGGAENRYLELRISVYKVSGGTPTQIGSTMTSAQTASTAGGVKSNTVNMATSSGGRVHFAAGDILRLNVQLWGLSTSASSEIGYGVDPQDRDDGTDAAGIDQVIANEDTTQLKLQVPFIIDI